MEKKLFTHGEWDQVSSMEFSFYGCKLIRPVGEFPAGSRFQVISVDYDTGKMQFWRVGPEPVAEFDIEICVKETNGAK